MFEWQSHDQCYISDWEWNGWVLGRKGTTILIVESKRGVRPNKFVRVNVFFALSGSFSLDSTMTNNDCTPNIDGVDRLLSIWYRINTVLQNTLFLRTELLPGIAILWTTVAHVQQLLLRVNNSKMPHSEPTSPSNQLLQFDRFLHTVSILRTTPSRPWETTVHLTRPSIETSVKNSCSNSHSADIVFWVISSL